MKRMLSILCVLYLLTNCQSVDSSRDNTAKVFKTDSTQLVTLFQYKRTMSHDLSTLFSSNKYLDSIQLTLNSLNKCVSGKDIQSGKDAYPITGQIEIQKTHLKVTVFQNNVDLHKKEDIGWNGTYVIK